MSRHRLLSWLSAGALGVSLSLQPATAQAEPNDVTGPGITGGLLLGAEAVLLVESAIGVKNGWAYLIGGVLGAGGGAVGGYYSAQTDSEELPIFLLAGGIVLIIPTVVAVLSATAYEPPTQFSDDMASLQLKLQSAPPAFVGIDDGEFALTVPAISLRDLYTKEEVSQFGEEQGKEVRVPVFNLAF